MIKATAVEFTNYSSEDFKHSWDSTEYSFSAGSTIMLEQGLATHFAKHLAVRELNKREEQTGETILKEEMAKCFSGVSIQAEDKTKLKQKTINSNKEKTVKKEEVKDKKIIKDLEGFKK